MCSTTIRHLAGLVVLSTCLCTRLAVAQVEPTPEQRAAHYLATEVPKWHGENNCYSCHNNGDAARSLLLAKQHGLVDDDAAYRDTLLFLGTPEQWDANGPDGPFKDKKLARIQFGVALAEADRAGLIDRPQTLESAARLVAELQNDDGSWSTDAAGTVGSPVTYGQPLATLLAAESLRQFDAHEYSPQLGKARSWFEATSPKSVLDAAATLLALAEVRSPKAKLHRDEALTLIREGESPDGGWGPFVNSPPEVFDTAVVLLALVAQKNREDYGEVIARGRQYLIAMQQADGSWPPTTRPPGVDSYAQQMSTTGWALQALLTTNRRQQTTPQPVR